MYKKYTVWIVSIVIAVAGAFWVAKLFSSNSIFKSSDKPKVATTIYPLYDITRTLAGDLIDVGLIVDTGSSPHTFSISSKKLKELSQADAVFSFGHGVDNYIIDEIVQALGLHSVVVDSGSTLISDGEEGEDPHYWLSLNNSAAIARAVSDNLIALYPQYQVEIESNLAIFIKNTEQLQKFYQNKFAEQDIKIATFHNAFAYLADSVGFEVVATFEEFPGEEPSAAWLKEFSDQIQKNSITVLYAEPQFSTSAIESLATDLGVKIDTLDPLGGSNEAYSYITMIKYNLDKILANSVVENSEEN